jgi:hypothetical protein
MRRLADRIVGLRQLADEDMPWPQVHIVPLAQQAQLERAPSRNTSCGSHDYRTTRQFRRQFEPSLGETGATSSLRARPSQAASSSREPGLGPACLSTNNAAAAGPAPAAGVTELGSEFRRISPVLGTSDADEEGYRVSEEAPASTPQSASTSRGSSSSGTALFQSSARHSFYYYYYEEGYLVSEEPPANTRRRRPQSASTAKGSSSSGAAELGSEPDLPRM